MLHIPIGANTFGREQKNAPDTPATVAYGTSINPSTGAKGAWVDLVASVAENSFGLLICFNANGASATSKNVVADIGIDELGGTSYRVLIADLLCGNAANYSLGGFWYYFPLFVPAGSRIAVRLWGTAVTSVATMVQLSQSPMNASAIKRATYVQTLGVTGRAGVSMTVGSGSEGGWTLIGTTSKRAWWWQIGAQTSSADTTHNTGAYHIDVAVGDASNKDIVIKDAQVISNASEYWSKPPLTSGVEHPVPAGVQVWARVEASATPDPLTIAVYAAGG